MTDPTNLEGSWLQTPQKARKTAPYSYSDVLTNGLIQFMINGAVLIAINSGLALSLNYFKRRKIIPLEIAVLAAGGSSTFHHLIVDGRSCIEKRDIRAEIPFMGTEKIVGVVLSFLLSPVVTYYSARYLLKVHVTVLQSFGLSALGAATLYVSETVNS